MEINLAEQIIPNIDDWKLKDIKSLELLTKEQVVQLYNNFIKNDDTNEEEIKVFITALYYMKFGAFIEDKDSQVSYVLMDNATNEYFDGYGGTTKNIYEAMMYETKDIAKIEKSKKDYLEDWSIHELQLGVKYMRKVSE